MEQKYERYIPKAISRVGRKVKLAQKKITDHLVQTSITGYFNKMRKSSSIVDLVEDKPQGKRSD